MTDGITFSGFTKRIDWSNVGEYAPTQIDEAKKANNRLVSICGKYYTIILLGGEKLSLVGKRAFDKWAKSNEYVTDF